MKSLKEMLRRNPTLVIAGAVLAMVRPMTGEGAEQKVSASREGWTLTAEPTAGVLGIRHARLGALLANVRLQVQTSQDLSPARAWTISRGENGRLVIQTAEPSR